MERLTKERRGEGDSVLDLDPKSGVAGGVQDVYGEDQATEEHFITPWTVSVARGEIDMRAIEGDVDGEILLLGESSET
ncbi:hypothetical protein M5K25_008045 [Dendrobium thyrsiflorum]|uniref:Uncharacterized protein n=1 Tax=Dendrobium thyrsiflorum TaxID=117978 RepID=A0ABD0V701_DENTH